MYTATAVMTMATGDDAGEYLVLSSDRTTVYTVTADSCTCKGFQFRSQCKHVAAVAKRLAPVVPTCGTCGKVSKYRKCAYCTLFES